MDFSGHWRAESSAFLQLFCPRNVPNAAVAQRIVEVPLANLVQNVEHVRLWTYYSDVNFTRCRGHFPSAALASIAILAVSHAPSGDVVASPPARSQRIIDLLAPERSWSVSQNTD